MNQELTAKDTHSDWENGDMGKNENYVRKSLDSGTVDEKLGLIPVSIRLQESLIENLKIIAKSQGIGYQPLIKLVLHKYVAAELNQK